MDRKIKLVLFGDSITARNEGFEQPILSMKLQEKIGENWLIINAGVPGDNTFNAVSEYKI